MTDYFECPRHWELPDRIQVVTALQFQVRAQGIILHLSSHKLGNGWTTASLRTSTEMTLERIVSVTEE